MKSFFKWCKEKLLQLDQAIYMYEHRYDYRTDLTIDRYGEKFELVNTWTDYDHLALSDAFDMVKDIFEQYVLHGWSGNPLLEKIRLELLNGRYSYQFNYRVNDANEYIDRLYIQGTELKLRSKQNEKR